MQENKQEKSPIKQRILQYLGENRISMYDCYAKTGITRGILGQNNGISEDNLARFLAYYTEVNTEWLVTGRGSMLRSEQEQLISQSVTPSVSSAEEPYIYKIYQDQLKIAQEEKEGKEALIKENGRLEERVRTLEEKISTYQDKEPDSPTAASLVTEAFTEEPSGDSTKDYIHTRKPTTTKRSSDLKT